MTGVWNSGEEYRYLLNAHVRNAVESARRSSTIFWSKAVMLHWGGQGRATCWREARPEAPCVCVCVCVCVCSRARVCSNHGRCMCVCVSVCTRTCSSNGRYHSTFPTLPSSTSECRLRVTEASWPVQWHGCFEESPPSPPPPWLLHRRWVNRPQRGESWLKITLQDSGST